MILSDRDIQELKRIHQEEFNETLSDAEAREMGARLIQLYEILARPTPGETRDEGSKAKRSNPA